jgi:carbamoyltransferase
MRILGFSGVAGAEPFKRANWAGRDEREYRISQGYDSAAALVVDGVIVAAVAEERLCRRKHTGEFPTRAIHYCLAEGGLRLEDLDELVHGFDYAPVKPLLP